MNSPGLAIAAGAAVNVFCAAVLASLENLDGLDNPTQKFVMRGVPHTRALQTLLAQDVTPGALFLTGQNANFNTSPARRHGTIRSSRLGDWADNVDVVHPARTIDNFPNGHATLFL